MSAATILEHTPEVGEKAGWSRRGVRPSSGAETQGEPVALGQADPPERADVPAVEDGRTPLNAYDRR